MISGQGISQGESHGRETRFCFSKIAHAVSRCLGDFSPSSLATLAVSASAPCIAIRALSPPFNVDQPPPFCLDNSSCVSDYPPDSGCANTPLYTCAQKREAAAGPDLMV